MSRKKESALSKTQPVNQDYWDDLFKKMQATGSGRAIYLKEGRTRLRLLAPIDGTPADAVQEVTTYYKGKSKTKFAFPAINLDDAEQDAPKLLVVAKTAAQGIIGLLAEGYDLFSQTDGHGISIMRSGTGRNTAFNVVPSPKPVPVNDDFSQAVTKEWLQTAVQEYNDFQKSRAENPDDGEASEKSSDW